MTFVLNNKVNYYSKFSLYDYLANLKVDSTQKWIEPNVFINPISSLGQLSIDLTINQPKSAINPINKNMNTAPIIQYENKFYRLKSGNDKLNPFANNSISNEDNSQISLLQVLNETKGIINLGNSCYMNSILQILIHCLPFMVEFTSIPYGVISNKDIAYSFYLLVRNMLKCPKYENDKIMQFYLSFVAKDPSFEQFTQQDSGHFLLAFLSKVSIELNEATPSASALLKSEITSQPTDKRQMLNDFIKANKSKEESLVTRVFTWITISTYQCQNCALTCYSLDQVIELPFSLTSIATSCNANALIENYFFKEPMLDSITNCSECHQRCKVKQMNAICSLPQVLILSLKRGSLSFEGINGKNMAEVGLEEVIDMKNYVDKEVFDNGTTTSYALFATLHHEGSAHDGHFYCFIKVGGQWMKFEDSVVSSWVNSKVELNTVLSVYYMRKDVIDKYLIEVQ